jgi:hypothetical protein
VDEPVAGVEAAGVDGVEPVGGCAAGDVTCTLSSSARWTRP